MVFLDTIDGQTDHLHAAFSELRTQRDGSPQLGGADGSVVPRVREQDAPAIEGKISESLTRTVRHSLLFLCSNSSPVGAEGDFQKLDARTGKLELLS